MLYYSYSCIYRKGIMRKNEGILNLDKKSSNPNELGATIDVIKKTEVKHQDITGSAESAIETKTKLNKIRAELGLPPEKQMESLRRLETDESQKQPEAARETARAGRAALLKKILFSRIKQIEDLVTIPPSVHKIAHYIPYLGDVALAKSIILGKEGGRDLSGRERTIYAMAFAMSSLSLLLLYEGNVALGGSVQTAVQIILSLDALPSTLKTSTDALKTKNPKFAHMVDACSDFLLSKREKLIELKNSLKGVNLEKLFKNMDINTDYSAAAS